jgi:hypothetical protein
MTIDWFLLCLAVALLFPPLPLSARLRKYVLGLRPKGPPSVGQMLRAWQNWVDFLRAGAGAYLLHEWALRTVPGVEGAEVKKLAVEASLFTISLVLQIVRFEKITQLIGPVFYLSGITLALSGLTIGLFAVCVGWVFYIGGGKPGLLLPTAGVALGAAGYVFGLDLFLLLNGVLILTPLFLEFLLQKPLLFVACPPVTIPPQPRPAATKI